jgi:phosphohistidine swiveling domain-containing protein
MTSQFGGKADGLIDLKKIPAITVPDFAPVAAQASEMDMAGIVQQFLASRTTQEPIAVRSSALVEDTELSSMAGAFDTLLNVNPDFESIMQAIRTIKNDGQQKIERTMDVDPSVGNMVGIVIQDMVTEPELSGVILSANLTDLNKNYALINYAHGYGTEIVNGQQTGHVLSVMRHSDYQAETIEKHPFLPQLMDAFTQIEEHFDHKAMDVEFCYKNGQVYILQARPLVIANRDLDTNPDFKKHVDQLQAQIQTTIAPDDFCGDMIDINPGELLGDHVLPLNMDLFRLMFSDSIIEQSRKNMGYDPAMQGLLRPIGNKPYVSLKASSYSLRPDGLDDADYAALYNTYLQKLRTYPSLQDRVEFDVYAITPETLAPILEQHPDLNADALLPAFQNLTEKITTRIAHFDSEYHDFMTSYDQKLSHTEGKTLADHLHDLTDGTEFFVQAARLAFFNKIFFETRHDSEISTQAFAGIHTVSTELQDDLIDFAEGKIDRTILSDKYGHLRMGQMDLTAEHYAADIDRYLNLPYYASLSEQNISDLKQKRTEKTMRDNGFIACLDEDTTRDVDHLRLTFAAREGVKFQFMRAYQHVTEAITSIGQEHGFSIQDMAYLSLQDVQALEQGSLSPHTAQQRICDNKHTYDLNKQIKMPTHLHANSDLHCIEKDAKTGNYFTEETVKAPFIVINEDNIHTITKEMVENKIVILEKADAGFDSVLLYNPAGIITKVGGPASHIAVRVNEHAIPACIGSGIDMTAYDPKSHIILDCKRKLFHSTYGV